MRITSAIVAVYWYCFAACSFAGDLELHVVLSPEIGRIDHNGLIAAKSFERFGLGAPIRKDRDGSLVFALPHEATLAEHEE